MLRPYRSLIVISTILALSPILGNRIAAQEEEEEKSWSFTSEFSGVWTAGNSEARTFGVDAAFRYEWARSTFELKGGSVRSEATTTTRTAVGTSTSNYNIVEESINAKTAESFYVRGRYDFALSEAFSAFGGVDWIRNTFAGIDSRLLFAGGAGNTWADNDNVKFKTGYSGTYTFQEDVVSNPFVKTNFPGVRVTMDLWLKVSESTEYTGAIIADENLDNTDDLRIVMSNELPISINSSLAFKPSLQLTWRNDPSLTSLALQRPDGTPTGDNVLVPLNKTDAVFKVALVLKL